MLRHIGVGKQAMAVGTLVLLLCQASCGRAWQASLSTPSGAHFAVDRHLLEGMSRFAEEVGGQSAVPLERLLVAAGHEVVVSLTVTSRDGEMREFQWSAVASQAWWRKDGDLEIIGQRIRASHLQACPSGLLAKVRVRIIDLAPTAAAAMGLRAPARAEGQVLQPITAQRVLLLYLDGLGYLRYEQARRAGLAANLSAFGEPLVGLTVYPPSTRTATAALLTGAPPEVNGVDSRDVRQTEVETLFDVASAAGRRVVTVEGAALSFNLRNSEIELSGDRDANGRTDDNVLANARAVLAAGAPDLLLVHLHGIDDAGHTFGPGTAGESAAIQEADAAVGQIVQALPRGSLVIIFSDHGMHAVQEEGRLGNHGNLIADDMLVPVWVVNR